MTQRIAYRMFWDVLTREIGGLRFTLYYLGVFAPAVLTWTFAATAPMGYGKPKTYITELDYYRSLARSYKERCSDPFVIEAGQIRDYLTERMREKLNEIERDK